MAKRRNGTITVTVETLTGATEECILPTDSVLAALREEGYTELDPDKALVYHSPENGPMSLIDPEAFDTLQLRDGDKVIFHRKSGKQGA